MSGDGFQTTGRAVRACGCKENHYQNMFHRAIGETNTRTYTKSFKINKQKLGNTFPFSKAERSRGLLPVIHQQQGDASTGSELKQKADCRRAARCRYTHPSVPPFPRLPLQWGNAAPPRAICIAQQTAPSKQSRVLSS